MIETTDTHIVRTEIVNNCLRVTVMELATNTGKYVDLDLPRAEAFLSDVRQLVAQMPNWMGEATLATADPLIGSSGQRGNS